MTEFMAGLILGAVLGVVVDRLWAWYETRPRIELQISYFRNQRGEGLAYTVRNVGSSEIPDYGIGLFHPDRGTAFVFTSEDSGPLLPDQYRTHECVLIRQAVPDAFLARWISRERNIEIEDPIFEKFTLRVVISKSERVIFESKKMGNALAKAWHRWLVLGEGRGESFEEYKALCSRPAFGIKYWLERRTKRIAIDRIIQENKNSEQ